MDALMFYQGFEVVPVEESGLRRFAEGAVGVVHVRIE